MSGPDVTPGTTPDRRPMAGVPTPRPGDSQPGAQRPVVDPDANAATRSPSRLDLVSRLARTVTARLDLTDVLTETFRQLRLLVRFTGGSIQLLDEEGWIRLAAADPAAADELFDVKIPLDSTIAGRVVLTEAPVYLPDILRDER